jgi:hypothetical protein
MVIISSMAEKPAADLIERIRLNMPEDAAIRGPKPSFAAKML